MYVVTDVKFDETSCETPILVEHGFESTTSHQNEKDLMTEEQCFDEQDVHGQNLQLDQSLTDQGPSLDLESSSSDQLSGQSSMGNETVDQSVRRRPGRPSGSRNKPREHPAPHSMTRRNQVMIVQEDPLTVEEALSGPDRDDWMAAMDDEYNALVKNQTWILVDRPKDCPVVRCKWVLCTKRHPDGSPYKKKGRLVGMGFTQRKGRDYHQTYSPVARYDSIRLLLAVTAEEDLELMQFDIQNAFLKGNLEETVFMEQPPMFGDGSSKVCLLKKSLYGLKQAPRCWNLTLDDYLKSIGLVRTDSDACVYVSKTERIILCLYVDDGLIACRRPSDLHQILSDLHEKFSITSSQPQCFVGLQIERDRKNRTISIHQEGYISRILEKFAMTDCKPCVTPGDSKEKLSDDMSPSTEVEKSLMEKIPYREVVGSLMFAMTVSRPDIAYQVSQVARFCQNPGQRHWIAVKRILRYLKGTNGLKIVYGLPFDDSMSAECGQDPMKPIAFSDADWAANLDNRRSTYGSLVVVNGGPVVWQSKLQKSVACSTHEAEYVAISETTRDLIWVTQYLRDLGYQPQEPMTVFSDNQGAIATTENPDSHHRTKHIDVKYHFIRGLVQSGDLVVKYTSTRKQPADMLTKTLTGPSLALCRKMLNLSV